MKIIQNGEVFVILIEVCLGIIHGHSNAHRSSDICAHWNGRRHFLELGERGDLNALNVSSSVLRSTLYTPLNSNNRTSSDIWYQCNLELVTCAECVIRITFTHTNFSKTCDKPLTHVGNQRSWCPCDHILFTEPPYDPSISGQYYCGDGKVYRSRTRTLMLKFFYRATHTHVFTLQYYSERNVKITSGSPKQSIISNYTQFMSQVISTPYFPVPYPRDYEIEHILTCDADNCRVRLEFTDFQLGLTSTMEIFDSNGQMLDSYTGENFRPPITVSTGKSLLLQFRGNGVTGLGYRGEVTFISAKQLELKETIPCTDCGGMVTGLGGAITMMNMLDNNSTGIRFYDCIWIIKPGNNYMMMKTHVSVRVESLYGMASRSELIVRQGITSESPEIETIKWPNTGLDKMNHVAPVLTGFYLRLKGGFGMPSRVAIVYSVFNYMNCYIGSEFLCQNNHCISIRLHCDGFDHCGDGSDEPQDCQQEWAHISNDRRWYAHKPNYYFPKIEHYPDLRVATGVFIMSTLGILFVISGWMVILYRMGVRARNHRELENHLQTISELLDRQEDQPLDDPPDYEAPPDYEEVIKVGMDEEIDVSRRRRRHRRHHHHHHSQSRSRSRSNSNTPESPQINALSLPSTSTAPPVFPPKNLQEIANRVLTATALCESAKATTPSVGNRFQCNISSTHNGALSSNSSISYGGELPSNMPQQNSNYSIGTPTQFEESSTEFKDASLNVSLSLAMSQTPLGIHPPHSVNTLFTESNNSRKSWLVFNNPEKNLNKRRLRHTYSTPESFVTDCLLSQETNYGSYLHSDRNSFLSNASTFGSDLPRDISLEQCNNQNDTLTSPDTSPIIEPRVHQSTIAERFPGQSEQLNNSSIDISCFGNMTIFGNNKRHPGKRYVRSRSFNQSKKRTQPSRLKRSSSADLLLVTLPRTDSYG